MDRERVITVLESLAETLHDGDAVRALLTASTLLKQQKGRKLTAAGAPWTSEEDARLCNEFDAMMTTAQIALLHGRSSGAITSRLVKLGRIDPAQVQSRDRGLRVVT